MRGYNNQRTRLHQLQSPRNYFLEDCVHTLTWFRADLARRGKGTRSIRTVENVPRYGFPFVDWCWACLRKFS